MIGRRTFHLLCFCALTPPEKMELRSCLCAAGTFCPSRRRVFWRRPKKLDFDVQRLCELPLCRTTAGFESVWNLDTPAASLSARRTSLNLTVSSKPADGNSATWEKKVLHTRV